MLLLAGLAYMYFQKKDGTKTDGEKGKEPLKDIEKPTSQTPLSATSGEGGAAVKNRIAEILRSTEASKIRRAQGIGGDMFRDVANEKAKTRIRSNAIGSLTDEYELQLIPPSIDPAFIGKVNELVAFTDNASEAKIRDYGESRYSQRLIQLANFTDTSNFKLINKIGDLIDNNGGFGECKKSWKDVTNVGLIIPGNAEDSCKIQNLKKLSIALNSIGKRMQKETTSFDGAVKLYAISEMKNAGWQFVGY